MDNKSLSHTKWKCQYHIVFIPKYRKKVLYGKLRNNVREILSTLCKYKDVEIIAGAVCVPVNSKIQQNLRRVRFENMIYIADGPSDIPAFSVVKKGGGATFAIYPKGDMKAMQQVEEMREDGRVDMYAEADYSDGTTAYMWITNEILKIANRIRDTEKAKIANSASGVPRHLL